MTTSENVPPFIAWPADRCRCHEVPEYLWTGDGYGHYDPATQLEPDPGCPQHFPKILVDRHQLEQLVATGLSVVVPIVREFQRVLGLTDQQLDPWPGPPMPSDDGVEPLL